MRKKMLKPKNPRKLVVEENERESPSSVPKVTQGQDIAEASRESWRFSVGQECFFMVGNLS